MKNALAGCKTVKNQSININNIIVSINRPSECKYHVIKHVFWAYMIYNDVRGGNQIWKCILLNLDERKKYKHFECMSQKHFPKFGILIVMGEKTQNLVSTEYIYMPTSHSHIFLTSPYVPPKSVKVHR
jgi:hypothetical protein